MLTTTAGTDMKAQFVAMLALTATVGVVAMVPAQWRPAVKRAWSYGVYYLGYRLLSVQISCGSLAVSGVPFVMKHL